MPEPRSVFDMANRPSAPTVGVALAIVVVLAMSSVLLGSRKPSAADPATTSSSTNGVTSPAVEAPLSTRHYLGTLDGLRIRLQQLNPSMPSSRLVWSPLVHDDGGDYHAMWFGRVSSLRADVDASDQPTKLTLHTERSESHLQNERLARLMVNVAAPTAPVQVRASSAAALAALMSRDALTMPPATSLQVGDVRMTLDMGALDFDLSASPSAKAT